MLRVANISKRYGDVVALDNASFDVRPGRILGFLGRNGAGKTTTMRCVFGLVEPDTGSITIDGAPITDSARLRFGYMPEERGLYLRMKVHEQLVYFGKLSGMAKPDASAAADHWLSELGLADRRDAKLQELSHGNQQRVQLATAVLHDPDVLVLDEPFAGLDPIGVASLSEVLHSFAGRGASILFSSHQLDLVEDVCDDVAIIHGGTVVESGSLDDLRERATYRRLEIRIDGRPWTPPIEGVSTVTSGGDSHDIADASVSVDQLLSAARAEGNITRFSYRAPGLQDLFRDAVSE
ncbi:MAG: ATP-binding cassette domain-containing protein [Armatimonadetes bacterium]|nr:MAG: ATP-binding cassette domain-containing protein [Armatimonadota bacterium]